MCFRTTRRRRVRVVGAAVPSRGAGSQMGGGCARLHSERYRAAARMNGRLTPVNSTNHPVIGSLGRVHSSVVRAYRLPHRDVQVRVADFQARAGGPIGSSGERLACSRVRPRSSVRHVGWREEQARIANERVALRMNGPPVPVKVLRPCASRLIEAALEARLFTQAPCRPRRPGPPCYCSRCGLEHWHEMIGDATFEDASSTGWCTMPTGSPSPAARSADSLPPRRSPVSVQGDHAFRSMSIIG